jgi:hypothetical protein
MKKLLILSLLLATSSLVNGQIIVTLMLPDPCFSDTTVTFRPLDLQDVLMYPNPTKDKLTIDIERTGVSQPAYIEVYNILGIRVMTAQHPDNKTITIDLSYYPPGIYFISLTSGNSTIRKKIIKQ